MLTNPDFFPVQNIDERTIANITVKKGSKMKISDGTLYVSFRIADAEVKNSDYYVTI